MYMYVITLSKGTYTMLQLCIFSVMMYFGPVAFIYNKSIVLYSTVFQLYRLGQCTYPCFPGVLITSTPRSILSKPLTAFPHNHCRNNGQRTERNKSCRKAYHQSSQRISAEPGIEPATSFSKVRNATD